MINLYCNQSIPLKTKTTVSKYNEPTYTSSTIKARFQYKRRMITTKNGQNIVSEAQLYTTSLIKEDDLITYDGKDWPIVVVETIVGLNGATSHYEAYI